MLNRPLFSNCHLNLLRHSKRSFSLSTNHNFHLQIRRRVSNNASAAAVTAGILYAVRRPRIMTASETLLPSIAMGPSQQQHTAAASVMNGHGPEAESITVDRRDQGFTFSPEQEALFEEQESLAIVQELTASSEWHEVKAYGHMSDAAREVSLTATTLRGDGKIALRPLKFFNQDKTECVIVLHLGRNLCGHAGIIHGGMLGTLLDEHLAYVSLPSLPNYTGFTANLSVDYRKPCKAGQWVVIRGKLDRVEGRKAYAHARIETANDQTLLTEATALYISPRTVAAGPARQDQP